MSQNDALFSPDLKERLAATCVYDSHTSNNTEEEWIAGCRGAANAFVVMLGPSPGTPDPGEKLLTRTPQRPTWHHPFRIGPNAGVSLQPFGSGKKARPGWGRLFTAGFSEKSPNTQAANALTGIWNLDWCHQSRETGTPDEALREGAETIIELVTKVKPRVIFTLSAKVNDTFWESISQFQCEKSGAPLENTQPVEVLFPGVPFPTLVLRSIRHPSYNTLNASRLTALTECVGTFLKSTAS
jgi:hypothetical protein